MKEVFNDAMLSGNQQIVTTTTGNNGYPEHLKQAMTKEEFMNLSIKDSDYILFLQNNGKEKESVYIEKIRQVDFQTYRINGRPIEGLTYKTSAEVLRNKHLVELLLNQKTEGVTGDPDEEVSTDGIKTTTVEIHTSISRMPKDRPFMGFHRRIKAWLVISPKRYANGHWMYKSGIKNAALNGKNTEEIYSHFAVFGNPEEVQ